jgi:MarR family transcriptional regulator for hemolysin
MRPEKISIFDLNEVSFGKKFSLLGRLYLAELSRQLGHIGLDRNYSVLVIIHKMGEKCCQKYIADALKVDKTMMVSLLDDLTEKGFIKRVQNPADRREYWIQLTPKGKKGMPEILTKVSRLNKKIMKGVEISKMNRELKIIYENLLAISE